METTDQTLGDKASTIFYEAAKKTWMNRFCLLGEIVQPNEDFSGVRFCRMTQTRTTISEELYLGFCFDGIGTKIEIAERMDKWDTLAYDLFAMVVDDAVCAGAEPALIGTVLDVSTYDIRRIEQIAKGYINAAKTARIAVINGELANLGFRVQGWGDFRANWNAGCLWFANPDRLLKGDTIEHGDAIICLQETGCRSNGFTLLKSILQYQLGGNWHNTCLEGETLGVLALQPSRIYAPAIVDVLYLGKPNTTVHGIAHITGGGLPGKLTRLLKRRGLGADITKPFKPGKIFAYVRNQNLVPEKVAYETWNMGQGMIVITSPGAAKGFMSRILTNHNIQSEIIGEVKKQNFIRIFGNQGVHQWEYSIP